MFKKLSLLLLVCLMASCASTGNQSTDSQSATSAHAGGWLTNMEEAQKIAKAEGKDIFVFFTGSDWCTWCIKLVDEVISKQEFLDYAKDNFVLVELDFPQDEEILSKEQKAHNEKWRDRFTFEGFPTVFLTNALAEAYAMTGYEEGGEKKYIERLNELRTNKVVIPELTAKADRASGVERAKLLDKLLALQAKGAIVDAADAKVKEIIALTKNKDKDLYAKYASIESNQGIMTDMQALFTRGTMPTSKELIALYNKHSSVKSGDGLNELLAMIGDSHISEKKGTEGIAFMEKVASDDSYALDVRQSSVLFKGIILLNTEEDKMDEAMQYFDKVIEMDADSQVAQRAQMMKDEYSKQIVF